MKKKTLYMRAGFTLVETLVAISILSISILATFSAVQSGLAISSNAKDQVIAFYLVQETMEFLRNTRDENALQEAANNASGGVAVSWLKNIAETSSDPCWFGQSCRIDAYLKTPIVSCASDPGGVCMNLYQDTVVADATYGLFGYTSSWTPSEFKRTIQLEKVNDDEIIIHVTIAWRKGSLVISQSLFNTR